MIFIVSFLKKFTTKIRFSHEGLEKNILWNIYLKNRTWHPSNTDNKRSTDRNIIIMLLFQN